MEMIGRYKKLEKLGEGVYGVVYKGIFVETSDIVALKRCKNYDSDCGINAGVMREIAVLKSLKHINIINLLDVLLEPNNKLYLVFEYMERDLKMHMERVNLSAPMVKSFMMQLLKGLEFCHANRVMHRDLKPHNILIDANGNLKIADFGLARVFSLPERKYTHEITTLWYRAPEVMLGAPHYTAAVDIWAAGAIFVEMINKGTPLFPGDSEVDQLLRIFRILGTPTEETWQGVMSLSGMKPHFPPYPCRSLCESIKNMTEEELSLAHSMLTYQPNKRPSAKKLLEHSYFNPS
jgi:cyclin-dependent kinase